MIRVGRYLDRSVPPDVNSQRECVAGFAVCRIRSVETSGLLQGGIRGVDEGVVLIPLEVWNVDNGLFCTAQINPGQDICLGGLEEIVMPGTGGCLILLLFLELPRIESRHRPTVRDTAR
jgi:hypothetical protein